MPDAHRSGLFTVPLGTSLVDALADHLLTGRQGQAEALADTLILLPNNRAIKGLTESFVRQSEGGLLLPQMVAIGDLALDEQLAPLFDILGNPDTEPVPPAISDMDQRIILARLIRAHRPQTGPVEALKLARHLAAALNALEVEEKTLFDVRQHNLDADLQVHWQAAYGDFLELGSQFEAELQQRGLISAARRRNLLLTQFASALPQDQPIIAAGITTAAPAIVRVLRAISRLPQGMIVWPHVSLDMAKDDWDALGPIKREGLPDSAEETHPFYHLKLLFDRMAIGRDELQLFPQTSFAATLRPAERVFDRPDAVVDWTGLQKSQKQLPQVRLMVSNDSAEEALAISILIRQALETPEKRIALVTPDRELALRVTAQLRRWDIHIDDSAGQPLLQQPPATLLLALAQCFEDHIGPVSLLSVLKHPLVRAGDGRLGWLEQVRLLDAALRGPRLGLGLGAITQAVEATHKPDQPAPPVVAWWRDISPLFARFDGKNRMAIPDFLEMLADLASALTDGKVWLGQSGRQLAQLLETYAGMDLRGIGEADRTAAPKLLAQLLEGEVIRPVYGSHPRIALYGLLEARLQQADLVICGGLNEGSWPQKPTPDPWLAPRLRRELDLPGLERNIGLSAHDLMSLLGAKEVVLSRADRDRGGPAVASRFLLRIQALLGDNLAKETRAVELAQALDATLPEIHIDPPSLSPSAAQRKVTISVTQVDLLKADPFAFYAKKILNLPVLSEVDAEPDAAWRGTAIHSILEDWALKDGLVPQKLIERADALLANPAISPVTRTLWQPRISAALHWLAGESARQQAEEGRNLLVAECSGNMKLAGVTLTGKADRIDRDADGGLVVIDYKTGAAPPLNKIAAGFALQLGLIGLIAQDGGFNMVSGTASRFEYWTLNKNKDGGFGQIGRPVESKKMKEEVKADFIGFAEEETEKAFNSWINGDAAFTAKLVPEYAVGADYDQLARVTEWYGRQPSGDAA
jgi:ATP-dependent helicase/nuclease subunit B